MRTMQPLGTASCIMCGGELKRQPGEPWKHANGTAAAHFVVHQPAPAERKRNRWYIGLKAHGLFPEAFAADVEPTTATHGHLYRATCGPMSKRAAKWCEWHPHAHWDTISELEDMVQRERTI